MGDTGNIRPRQKRTPSVKGWGKVPYLLKKRVFALAWVGIPFKPEVERIRGAFKGF